MKEDIERVIKACEVCHRNHLVTATEHRALEVTGIFDRIGIDLTFGLPETSEGYKVFW
jgi:hypothetical protein